MRRVLRAIVGGFASRVQAFLSGWRRFWFTPADTTLLGFVRILAAAMLLYTHAVWGLALEDFFGPNGWLQADAVRAFQSNQYAYSFWWWIPEAWIWPVHFAAVAVIAVSMLGLCTRLTTILSFAITVSYVHRVPSALFGLDQINGMLSLYLAIGYLGVRPRDRTLSLDRWISRLFAQRRDDRQARAPQPSVTANLGIRLIQVHMCVIYFFAGIAKLQGPAWWSGEAMWLAFANLEYQSADLTWLAHHPWIVNTMSHFTILWEIFFCTLIWMKWWRPLMLAAAVVLHIGIGACLGMWTFGLVMLIGCAAFLPAELVQAMFGTSPTSSEKASQPNAHLRSTVERRASVPVPVDTNGDTAAGNGGSINGDRPVPEHSAEADA